VTEISELVHELQDKATRDAFVSSQMSIPLAFQILALREQRGMTQKQLAEKADMLQPRIAAMERPSGSEPNLRTLKRLASAFDVALVVRFVPFSKLVEWAETFSPDTFIVPSFNDDPGFHEEVVEGDGQTHNNEVQDTISMAGSSLRIHTRRKSTSLPNQNFELDFAPATPSPNNVPAQVKITDTAHKGEIRYEGRVGSEQRPAA
jgi:transcriptional regulator with XRE-family HTH domain